MNKVIHCFFTAAALVGLAALGGCSRPAQAGQAVITVNGSSQNSTKAGSHHGTTEVQIGSSGINVTSGSSRIRIGSGGVRITDQTNVTDGFGGHTRPSPAHHETQTLIYNPDIAA